MNIRKVRRKCSVRGCKNTDCFAISKVNEVGNSVIICDSCLKEGLEAVSGYIPEKKKPHTEPPSLFYNKPVVSASDEPVEAVSDEAQKQDVLKEEQEDISEETKTADEFVCPECGKSCATKAGLAKHIKTHNKDKEGE